MPAITFENVSKKYRLGAPLGSLRDAIPHLLDQIRGRVMGQRSDSKHFWALKDVTFQVEQGEAIGIVGPNGAGKSTILKLLSGITEPTGGRIQVNGKLAALIEVGAGFHPDLTGRENIYLYGSIMGLKRKDIDKLFDSIVEFAELKDFIDTPIKRYSSGMHVRLGFAVIAHLDPDALLIDEVLAVGDMAFRVKCQERMNSFQKSGKSIVFVSHNLNAIQALCQRCLYLNNGQIAALGSTKEVLKFYFDETNKSMKRKGTALSERWGTGDVEIRELILFDVRGERTDVFKSGDTIHAIMRYFAHKEVFEPDFRLAFLSPDGVPITVASSARQGFIPKRIEGPGSAEFFFQEIPLVPNSYSLTAVICSIDGRIDYDVLPHATDFSVVSGGVSAGIVQKEMSILEGGLVRIPYKVISVA